jgi:hypothetical protein
MRLGNAAIADGARGTQGVVAVEIVKGIQHAREGAVHSSPNDAELNLDDLQLSVRACRYWCHVLSLLAGQQLGRIR